MTFFSFSVHRFLGSYKTSGHSVTARNVFVFIQILLIPIIKLSKTNICMLKNEYKKNFIFVIKTTKNLLTIISVYVSMIKHYPNLTDYSEKKKISHTHSHSKNPTEFKVSHDHLFLIYFFPNPARSGYLPE